MDKMGLEEIYDKFSKRNIKKKDIDVPVSDIRYEEGYHLDLKSGDTYKLTDHAFGQLVDKVRTLSGLSAGTMKTGYLRACPEKSKKTQINEWIKYYFDKEKDEKIWKLRTNEGTDLVEAIVSERYAPFDNEDLIDVIYKEYGNEIKFNNYYMDNNSLHLRYVDESVREGEGTRAVMAGWHLSNDEIGSSSIKVGFLIYQLVCANGLMGIRDYDNIYRQRHYGDLNKEKIRRDIAASLNGMDFGKSEDILRKFVAMSGIEIGHHPDDVFRAVNQTIPQIDFNMIDYAKDVIADYDDELNKFTLISSLTQAIRDMYSGSDRIAKERGVGKLFDMEELILKTGDNEQEIIEIGGY